MLDNFYIAVFNYYKQSLGKTSLKIALFYINLFELSLYLALSAFFLAFASQMKIPIMSMAKFWILFGLIGCFIIFKNWMRYNGKKRNVLKAKAKGKHSIFLLWLLPIGCLAIAIILLQVQ